MSKEQPIIRVPMQQGPLTFTVRRKSQNYISEPWQTTIRLPTHVVGVTLSTKGITFSGQHVDDIILECKPVDLPDWINLEELMRFLPTQGWEACELPYTR